MRAIVWQGPERMTVEERPDPGDPGAGEVLVQPGAVGICGSEVEGYLGHMGNRTPPLVMGHEFAGVVVAAGEGAAGWDGARVAVNPLAGCGRCRLCASGRENLCPRRTLIGVHHDGAFADLVRAPAANVRVLPDAMTARTGALVEPLANGVHAVRLGLAGEPVERALVIGAGTIGLMTLQAALLSGIERVAVLEPHDERRERALALGAHEVFADADEAGEELRAATDGLGADLALDAVGAEVTRRLAVTLIAPGARAVCIGLAADRTTLGFHDIVRGQLAIQGSYAYTMADFEQALEWLSEDRVSVGELAAVRPLEDGPEAFARLASGPPPADVKIFLAGAGREA
jgi:(R,R)-butanediol dehydrogenase / meso-butanediol dehydrogenase / diacetyl reductase